MRKFQSRNKATEYINTRASDTFDRKNTAPASCEGCEFKSRCWPSVDFMDKIVNEEKDFLEYVHNMSVAHTEDGFLHQAITASAVVKRILNALEDQDAFSVREAVDSIGDKRVSSQPLHEIPLAHRVQVPYYEYGVGYMWDLDDVLKEVRREISNIDALIELDNKLRRNTVNPTVNGAFDVIAKMQMLDPVKFARWLSEMEDLVKLSHEKGHTEAEITQASKRILELLSDVELARLTNMLGASGLIKQIGENVDAVRDDPCEGVANVEILYETDKLMPELAPRAVRRLRSNSMYSERAYAREKYSQSPLTKKYKYDYSASSYSFEQIVVIRKRDDILDDTQEEQEEMQYGGYEGDDVMPERRKRDSIFNSDDDDDSSPSYYEDDALRLLGAAPERISAREKAERKARIERMLSDSLMRSNSSLYNLAEVVLQAWQDDVFDDEDYEKWNEKIKNRSRYYGGYV